MIQRIGSMVTAVFRRIVPDPLVIAVVLTIGVFIAAVVWGRFPEEVVGPIDRSVWLLDAWRGGSGLWGLLAFAMQMCLILLGGHILAEAPPVRRMLRRVADIPRSASAAVALVGLVAMVLGIANWGLGLIGGAVLARETGRSLAGRGITAHYPLLAAAGYTGLLVWHGGFSGSAPLTMTTAAGAEKVLPKAMVGADTLAPLNTTILSPSNLLITGGLLFIVPMLLWLMSPKQNVQTIAAFLPDETSETNKRSSIGTFPDWLNHTRLMTTLLGLALLAAAIGSTIHHGIDRLALNDVIMYLLAAALLVQQSPESFMRAAARAAAGCAGIIVQFPLYAGIMGLMVASGLVQMLTSGLLELASPETLEFWTMVSAGIVNLLVPSGGGQWAVQGPIALTAAHEAGVGNGPMVMAVAYGDELTNMLQPFWALPLLAVTGVRARDIVGYTAIIMVVAGAWMSLWLLM
ncbi:MAG: TIGR00366 family protein [Phycisphaerales bacterium]|jgi:short-chain fatty acids transporter|nr:TIGR00366 family protein [Phycisphaerales bacterium]MDP6890966.1 TIGR00366 family protein [Phycisphaerales bacterium]